MANIAAVLKELRQERGRLDDAIVVLRKLAGTRHTSQRTVKRPRKPMSVAARRKIAAAQRARWARWKAKQQKKAA